MREAAQGLAQRGHAVEVLTTCARDHYTWADAYPPGTSVADGVTVRRFELAREEGRYPGQADRGDLDGVEKVHPKMIFDPPWSPEMMSEDAKFALGY